MLDLLIVGAGLTGLIAANTAAQAGLKVKIIGKGLGAAHWSAGTIDVLGYAPFLKQEYVVEPLDGVVQLTRHNEAHPYALLDEGELASALDSFRLLMNDAGLPYGQANKHENLLLPSPVGAARPTYLAPQAQIGGDLKKNEPMLIAGFEGMRDFYPLLIAENLAKMGLQTRGAIMPMDLITDRRDANTVQLAQGLDKETQRERLGQHLKGLVHPGERIGLPAILGLHKHAEVVAELERISGAAVFEIPTLPPSVPGIRLLAALQNHLRHLGVRIEPAMEVISAKVRAAENGTAGRVEWLESKTTARPMQHRAAKFLVATGGLLGGGFNSDHNGRVWETIFDLPLTIPQDRSEWFDRKFLSADGHPVFTGGVAVNRRFQPVTADRRVCYENLWAAGHMLAGADPIVERSTEGIAVATGAAAGKAIVAM
ncbi:MAG: glycerol-3-phosphate dehydrogenase subunit GlpB [Candidatus Promineifilaceae bacterium]|nr:glycerol-3-phosphate dehydrogenase subunit GlpB [Candidatus Promineifilaceae bacterium]